MTQENIDIIVCNGGTIWTFRGLTEAGKAFLRDDLETESWQWIGERLAVDHRPAQDLVQHMANTTELNVHLV